MKHNEGVPNPNGIEFLLIRLIDDRKSLLKFVFMSLMKEK